MSVKHLYLLLVAVALACSASGSTTGSSAAPRRYSVLTAAEISAAQADITSAYEAVERLRPNWLAARGPAAYAKVFVDGQQHGDLDSLRSIPAHLVASMQYYDVTQSTAKFGVLGGDAGAIDVMMRVR